MENIEIAKYFLRFLKKRNLYHLYREEFISFNKRKNWIEWSSIVRPSSYVLFAFSWANQPSAWATLDHDWHAELNKNNLENK